MGIGGGPEGVLAASALKCLGCQMQTRLKFYHNSEKERVNKLGIKDLDYKYNINDMVKDDVIFCASGVTDGELVKGIKNFDNYFESETFVLHKSSNTNSIIKNKRIMNYRMYRIIFLETQKKIFHHYAHLSRMVLWHNNQQAESQI